MNAQTIKSYVEIVANIGVLFGIFLLAYELRQNNNHLNEQAAYNRLQVQLDAQNRTLLNPDLTRLEWGTSSPEETDAVRRTTLVRDVLGRWEWEYDRVASGALRREQLPIASYRYVFKRGGYATEWAELKELYNSAFIDFMEASVVNQ